MKACILVAAGDFSEKYFDALLKIEPRPCVIAIDGGYAYLKKFGVTPDLALGDFDSLGYVPKDVETLIHPIRKDKTDMVLAIDTAVEMGFDTAYVLGAFGGSRFDHSISNLQTLYYAEDRLRLVYLDDKTVCFAVNDETLTISDESLEIRKNDDDLRLTAIAAEVVKAMPVHSAYLSIFARNEATVDIVGCSYSGQSLELTDAYPMGASNEITEEKAEIKANGQLIVMLAGKHN